MSEQKILTANLTYPYLTQLFGLSGWLVYTPIVITTNPFFERNLHINLKTTKKFIKFDGKNNGFSESSNSRTSVKENWLFFWDKIFLKQTGEFTDEFKKALIENLLLEKLTGYIFREPIVHFTAHEKICLSKIT